MSLRAHLRTVPARVALAAALATSSALFLPGCDNPACVFGGDCSGAGGGGGGLGAKPATLPSDGAWISPAAPSVERFYPQGTVISTDTPVAVVFSESMAPSTIGSALQLFIDDAGINQAVPTLPVTLAADGRMAILVPLAALQASQAYRIEYKDGASVTDLQGTEVLQPADRVIGRFTVAATNPSVPRVVGSFPADGATGQSTTGEYVVLFDRRINPVSVTTHSFAVTVNGQAPAPNPVATPLTIVAGAGVSTPEPRVWRYHSVAADGTPTLFPTSATVAAKLSPPGFPLTALTGGATLPTTDIDYVTSPFRAPDGAALVSLPSDALGLANFDGTAPLEIGLDLGTALSTDSLGMFVFGQSLETTPQLTALYRESTLTALGFDPQTFTASVGEAALDLVSSVAPVTPRLAEGSLSIGFVLKRGSASSPVRMLDVDPATAGLQSPLLDVTPPTFLGFGTSGTNLTSFRSDLRDLVVVGRGSEPIRAAEVSTALGDNGLLPDVLSATAQGTFVARPVDLEIVDPAQLPLPFTLRIYDRALNTAVASVSASYTQVGAVGPGLALPGNPTIDVQVVDARTLAPLGGALVFVHEDLGFSFDLFDLGTTDAAGNAQVEAALLGETILTVDAPGYDLFSFHGLPTSRINVPLERTGTVPGVLTGTLTSASDILDTFERYAADSRQLASAEPLVPIDTCTYNAQTDTTLCTFGPGVVRPGPLGAVAALAIETPAGSFNFAAATFLRAYALEMPVAGVSPQQASVVALEVGGLLSDSSTPQEQRALPGPSVALDASTAYGLVLSQLDGPPRVLVEGLAPAVQAPVCAGLGAALDPLGSPVDSWAVRSAIPGVVDPTDGKYAGDVRGELMESGALVGDLYLRCEARDALGGRSAVRLPFASAPAAASLPPLPVIVSPLINSTTAGPSYDVVFADALPDGGYPGLYRVALTDATGRSWVIWRIDTSGLARAVHLPDIAADGGAPLDSGPIAGRVTAYAWPGVDPSQLLFTDFERSTEILAQGPPQVWSQP